MAPAKKQSEFKSGDVVVLRSGGPKMTVTQVAAPGFGNDAPLAYCTWFAGKKNEHGNFRLETIVHARDDGVDE